MPTPVVTFDAGQTFIELDLDFLAVRLGERGISVAAAALVAAAPDAWREHDRKVLAGASHPWRELMAALLTGAGVPDVAAHVDWLWGQQPTRNLWRKTIPPMVELARELRAGGVRVAVLSNSEGHLAALLAEIGILDAFELVVDSGVFGIAKPDRRIFDHTLARLGVDPAEANAIHIGDSYAADVAGALGAGWRAIWYAPANAATSSDPRIAIARDAAQCRSAIERWVTR